VDLAGSDQICSGCALLKSVLDALPPNLSFREDLKKNVMFVRPQFFTYFGIVQNDSNEDFRYLCFRHHVGIQNCNCSF
jgi:hypothetical protein